MRQSLIWAAAAIVLLVLAGVVAYLMRPPRVTVVTVKAEPVERILAAVGRVRGRENVQVYARTPGQIVELKKDEGDRVVVGEILGRLDAAMQRAVVTQRKAAVAAQRRKLAQSQRDLARVETLAAKGFVTDERRETSRLTVQTDSEELTRLQASVAEAESRLEDFVIRAPMAGRILTRPLDPGQVVNTSTVIFEIVSQGPPEVETDVDETLAGALESGMRARLSPVGMGGAVFDGRVTFVAPNVDPTTGGRTVRLGFDAPPQEIPPGLSVDVNISVETIDRALTLPRSAIVAGADRESYVIAVRDGTAVKQAVTFVDWPAERVIVESGVREGELVAADPLGVAEGARVEASTP
jgi:HlyD family secretion protein/membrane fusion protein (multidrug efflux system)